MRCMNVKCGRDVHGDELKLYLGRVAVCRGCNELAEKASREVDVAFSRARKLADEALVERVLNGELFDAGSGANGVVIDPGVVQ